MRHTDIDSFGEAQRHGMVGIDVAAEEFREYCGCGGFEEKMAQRVAQRGGGDEFRGTHAGTNGA